MINIIGVFNFLATFITLKSQKCIYVDTNIYISCPGNNVYMKYTYIYPIVNHFSFLYDYTKGKNVWKNVFFRKIDANKKLAELVMTNERAEYFKVKSLVVCVTEYLFLMHFNSSLSLTSQNPSFQLPSKGVKPFLQSPSTLHPHSWLRLHKPLIFYPHFYKLKYNASLGWKSCRVSLYYYQPWIFKLHFFFRLKLLFSYLFFVPVSVCIFIYVFEFKHFLHTTLHQ